MAPQIPSISVPKPDQLLTQMRRDVERNYLRARNGIRLVRGTARPRSAVTPNDVVWQRGRARLRRYRNDSIRWRPPLLIVFSIVSRYYILDLTPGNSFVERLRNEGFDVYLLDFGEADERDAGNTLETYVDYVGDAITAAVRESDADAVNLVGYCFGGILTLLGLARSPDWPVRSLTTIAAPVDQREMGALANLARESNVDDVIDDTGNVPANLIVYGFRAGQPVGQLTQYADLLDGMWSDDYLAAYQLMTGWTNDQVPMAGAVARDIAENLIRSDSLPTQGTCRVGGRTVDLKNITVPFRSIVAESDSIAPPASSAPLPGLVGSADSAELRLPGGHIGLMVGRSAHKRSIPLLIDFFKSWSEPVDPAS
ncbi:MAG TPA: alpha/beta fold hydrolase [Jatrophihabitans sp.]|nr:alpha/beta fold hydrolase [Jatrophihabitans sp.]